MARFDRDKYVPVQDRINRFRQEHPGGAIVTTLMSLPDDATFCRYKAEVYREITDPLPASTGFATENAGTSASDGANFGNHEENCETSAIGRALANFGYATSADGRMSREEADKANRPQQPRNAPLARPEAQDAVKPAPRTNHIPKDEQASLIGLSQGEADWITKIGDAATLREIEAVRAELTSANVVSAPVWESFGKKRTAITSAR